MKHEYGVKILEIFFAVVVFTTLSYSTNVEILNNGTIYYGAFNIVDQSLQQFPNGVAVGVPNDILYYDGIAFVAHAAMPYQGVVLTYECPFISGSFLERLIPVDQPCTEPVSQTQINGNLIVVNYSSSPIFSPTFIRVSANYGLHCYPTGTYCWGDAMMPPTETTYVYVNHNTGVWTYVGSMVHQDWELSARTQLFPNFGDVYAIMLARAYSPLNYPSPAWDYTDAVSIE